MTLITMQDGKVVMRDDKAGTEQACCCGGECSIDADCALACDCCLAGQCFGFGEMPPDPQATCEGYGGIWDGNACCPGPAFPPIYYNCVDGPPGFDPESPVFDWIGGTGLGNCLGGCPKCVNGGCVCSGDCPP